MLHDIVKFRSCCPMRRYLIGGTGGSIIVASIRGKFKKFWRWPIKNIIFFFNVGFPSARLQLWKHLRYVYNLYSFVGLSNRQQRYSVDAIFWMARKIMVGSLMKQVLDVW